MYACVCVMRVSVSLCLTCAIDVAWQTREALGHFFETAGLKWGLWRWGALSSELDKWQGVSTQQFGREMDVVSLSLSRTKLVGRLHPALGSLQHLVVLRLANNSLFGIDMTFIAWAGSQQCRDGGCLTRAVGGGVCVCTKASCQQNLAT